MRGKRRIYRDFVVVLCRKMEGRGSWRRKVLGEAEIAEG